MVKNGRKGKRKRRKILGYEKERFISGSLSRAFSIDVRITRTREMRRSGSKKKKNIENEGRERRGEKR